LIERNASFNMQCHIIVNVLIMLFIDFYLFECVTYFTAENLLGGEGQGAYILMSGLDVERAIATSGSVG